MKPIKSSMPFNLRSWKKSEFLSLTAGLATCAISIAVLLGWIFDDAFLKSIVTGFISMKANTAIGLLCLAAALICLLVDQKLSSKKAKGLAAVLTLVTCLIAALTMAEYLSERNLGIDELFFIDVEGVGKRYPPGRLAPVTALSFLALGLALFVGFYKKKPLHRFSQALLFIVGLTSFQAVVSYALGIQTTFGLASHTRIAVHTAIGLIFICAGLAALCADKGFMKIIFSESQSGLLARRLIFAALFVPPFVNFVETQGLKGGYFDPDFGTLFRVIGSVVFFVVMVILNSEQLYVAEETRNEALNSASLKEKESARLMAEREANQARELSEEKFKNELIDARSRAEKAAEVKAVFLATMSHEIRTPLNGIIGISDLLADTPLNSQQKKYIETLQVSGNGLLAIINDILDFSKIEAGKMELERVDFNVRATLQTQLELLQGRAHAKGLVVKLEMDPALPAQLNGDAGRIGQVLLNLIANAIKFTEIGTIEVRATREPTSPGEGRVDVRFSVLDSGIGLSQASQEKLFQPFVQADGSTSRKYGGTGLGLSISRSLVTLMRGQIGVKSAEGDGSHFWFVIPLLETKARAQREESPRNAIKPILMGGRSPRILVAEDNTINQMVVMAHLKALGIEGQAVANGQEVLSAIAIGQFDLILMDCQMPEMDGFQATRQIRLDEKVTQKKIPIIALTANAMNEDRDRCLAAGMDAYLAKPFKREDLGVLIQYWLGSAYEA